jgi:hydrogenase maturation protein HypF
MPCERITLGGVVQGVGFRPFVHRLAQAHGVQGWVRNTGGEVEILAQAEAATLAAFRAALLAEAPPAADPKLVSVEKALFTGSGFRILHSGGDGTVQGLPSDLAPCPDCLREMGSALNRRHNYPFINCTQCGPRYSIIRTLPYDRANTSMAEFPLCSACAAEYANPQDRRFHAEPVACPACGPRLRYGVATGDSALAACLTALKAGQIVAVKGVGGYHLFCDAENGDAVGRLRARKHRPEKPLAVLLPENRVLDYVAADDPALYTPARPIVLLPKREGSKLAYWIAPGLAEVGVMLADSPLHHLLAEGFGRALVATSANRAGDPMVTDEATAEAELAGVADGFLHHDRPIIRAVDDSVVRVIGGAPRILRAGRGMSPIEMKLPFTLQRPVLACGGHLKSTITLAFDDKAVISPHLGDLDNEAAGTAFGRMAADLQALYGARAEALIVDAHPGYASTRWARAQGLPLFKVWHHFAHASALAGELGDETERLVFTWDGVGLGPDGTLWGGEALLGRPGNWRVAARFRRLRLQGGDAVARAPWRSAAALCWHTGLQPPEDLGADALAEKAWRQGMNCHDSSAVGRLFDAAAALLGLCHTASYEGQGPALVEAQVRELYAAQPLPLTQVDGVWEADWAPLMPLLLDHATAVTIRAAVFHAIIGATGVAMAQAVGARAAGLAGGVFQNRVLAETMLRGLHEAGIPAHMARKLPCNDAGLSFGQIIEAGSRNG